MTTQEKVHFLDITSALPVPSKSWSPNTLRTRMVLNYKGIPYTQSFLSYSDIQPLLQSRSIPPLTTTAMPYTLPAIIHPQTIKSNPAGIMNDSWPIAVHLDKTFPAPEYLPPFPWARASHALAVAAQTITVELIGRSRRIFIPKVPAILDEKGSEYYRVTRDWKKVYGMTLEELIAPGDELEEEWSGVHAEVEVLVKMLKVHQGKEEIVSFLAWVERTDKDWERFMSVGDGELMRLWEACLPWVNGQEEEKSIDIPKA